MGDKDLQKRYSNQLKDKTAELDKFIQSHPELKRDYARTKVTEEYNAKTIAERVGVTQEYWKESMSKDERGFCRDFPEEIQWIDRYVRDENGALLPSYDFTWKNRESDYELKTPTKSPKYRNIAEEISRAVSKSMQHGTEYRKENFMINLKNKVLSDKLKSQLEQYNLRRPQSTIKSLVVFARGKIIDIELKK